MGTRKKYDPSAGNQSEAGSKRQPTLKQRRAEEGMRQGKNRHRAHLDAGYAPSTAKSLPYNPRLNARVVESVARRRAEAIARAQSSTDTLVGYLYQIADASVGDVLDGRGEFSVGAARRNGVDHLIKKVKKTIRHTKEGARIETHEVEMYSRLEAIAQLRANFGMKQEPRPNTYDEDRRREVERALSRIAEREGVEQSEAARRLLEELGDDVPHITRIVHEFIH